MALAPQAEEMGRVMDDGSLVEDTEASSNQSSSPTRVQSQNGSKRNPPARNTSRFWFERFLSIIQRQNPSIIDVSFVSQIAPSNEGKLLAQLKYLRVIDELGKPTPLLPLLNLVGEEQKKGFNEMVTQSYPELLAEVKIDKAVVDDLINFFIRKYAFTRDKAVNASKFFLYLADKASLQLSPELTSFLGEKGTSNGHTPSGSAPATSPRVPERSTARPAPRETRIQIAPKSMASSRRSQIPALQSTIQASIEIKLDKDTPREYWDRVLALIGERKIDEDREPQEGNQPDQQNETSIAT